MIFFVNIYGLLFIPALTILLLFVISTNRIIKLFKNTATQHNALITIFSSGLFFSFIYTLFLYIFFKMDTTAYQYTSLLFFGLSQTHNVFFEYLYYIASASLLAIDGVALVFVILTPFTIIICAVITHQLPVSTHERSLYYIYLITIELFLFLAFTTTNLLIFYFAFEAVLLPIFLIIGRWGSNASKKQAANYIFVYTVVGSVLMLFAIVGILRYTGTANFLALKTLFAFQTNSELSL